MNYSVLMSVYQKEKPEYLKLAIESMQMQTVPTNDFVLVCDGPLNAELDAVIASKSEEMGSVLHVVRLGKNVGLGNALNEGITYCKNDIVARMDSDDISRPFRCEKQLAIFERDSKIGLVSGIVEEFLETPEAIDTRRVPPEHYKDILEFAKKRNPFNHPCVMYRKSEVESAGGYQEVFLLEDYFLWIRMLMNGTIGYNIQEPLLWMRAGSDLYKRRGGWKYAKAQIWLFSYMLDRGMINRVEWLRSVLIRAASGVSPTWLRKFVFQKTLRR